LHYPPRALPTYSAHRDRSEQRHDDGSDAYVALWLVMPGFLRCALGWSRPDSARDTQARPGAGARAAA